MGIISGFFRGSGKVMGRIVDVRVDKWIGYDYLKGTFNKTLQITKDTFQAETPSRQETFEEAIERLGLKPEDLINRKKEFTRLLVFHLFLTSLVIGYAIYMAFQGAIIATIISFCLSVWSTSQCFRYHFWLFQIRNRKLGCTLMEWFNSEINKEA